MTALLRQTRVWLATEYGVDRKTIADILSGKIWKE